MRSSSKKRATSARLPAFRHQPRRHLRRLHRPRRHGEGVGEATKQERAFMSKRPMRLFSLPRRTESLVRNVLLVGFLMLLALVAILGFTSYRSLVEMESEITLIRQTEVSQERSIRRVSETAGKIHSQAQTV